MYRLRSAALPFVVRRENWVVSSSWFNDEFTSTRDELYGLVRLVGDSLVWQWRRAREVSQFGREFRADRELAPVREAVIPLAGLATAEVRWLWRGLLPRPTLTVVAADLRALDPLAGDAEDPGLVFEHPGELVLEIRLSDRHLARNFASELRLAISEEMLRRLEESEHHADEPLPPARTLDHGLLAADAPSPGHDRLTHPRARAES